MDAHVDREARQELRELAVRHDRSLAAEIRRAIADQLERERTSAALVRP